MAKAKAEVYTPSVGDTVKVVGVENADNVLHGEVVRTELDGSFDLFLNHNYGEITIYSDDWKVERWVKPIAFKPFCVVKMRPGWERKLWGDQWVVDPAAETVFNRDPDGGWRDLAWDFDLVDEQVAILTSHGMVTVLFEGVSP